MDKLFDFLYNCIYELGMLTKKIFFGFFKKIGMLFKKLFRFNKASFSSAKIFFRRAVICVLIIAVALTSFYFINAKSNKINAVSIKMDGEIIGYTATREDADYAEKLLINKFGSENVGNITIEDTKAEPHQLKSADAISRLISEKLTENLVTVNEIYIDGELLCAITDTNILTDCVENIMASARKMYPEASVSFDKSITVKPGYYKTQNDERIFSAEKLEAALTNPETIKIRHTECEEKIDYTDFDTVEIKTNQLFVGDTRIRREGEKGTEYSIDLVTYIDNHRVMSEPLTSVAVTAPISRIVERGIRAESLSMGSYTVIQTLGIFCWPVVNLYTVTSPYGHRSLGYHNGIDISGANASGSLVVAGAAGTVTEAGWSTGGYGNYVKIDHGNGVETLYAHMLDNSLMVNVGDTVLKGQTIGRVGNTGYSFGAHLHFEVRINGNRVNPAPYLGLE